MKKSGSQQTNRLQTPHAGGVAKVSAPTVSNPKSVKLSPPRATVTEEAPPKPARAAAPPPTRSVRFSYQCPSAREVFVAGSFNHWHPRSTALVRTMDGLWIAEVELPFGEHQYRFVVDGQWCDDPAAAQSIPNSFGGCNAVLNIAPSDGRRSP